MNWIEALILGLVQGLTEFLPVSSSGHLQIGFRLLEMLGKEIPEENLTFITMVHFATVLSTITVFFAEIKNLSRGLFAFRWNEETRYVSKILLSMIPVLIIGFLFEERVENLFAGDIMIVGIALLITASLLISTQLVKAGTKKISFSDSFIMGIAQAVAVIPGISRSGATISTGLLLKNGRKDVARFSFLMVLLPIIGKALLDIMDILANGSESLSLLALISGFTAAYISGFLACKWMLRLVQKGNLYWFALYCGLLGISTILFLH